MRTTWPTPPPGPRGKALHQHGGHPFLRGVDDGVQQLVELRRSHARDRLVRCAQLLLDHVHGHADRGRPVALADPALQHPELALLDRELQVQHVVVVLFQALLDCVQLAVDPGELLLQGRKTRGVLGLARLVDGVGGADSRHHVLALGVGQPLAIEDVLARGGVAREGDARAGVIAHVAEHHGLHGDRGAPLIGDPLDAAVGDGALAVPALENRADASPHLLLRIFREVLAEDLLDLRLVNPDEGLQVLGGEVRVLLCAPGVLHLLQLALELLADAHALRGLDPLRLFHDDVRVHLDEAAVRIVDETRVVRGGDDALGRLFIEADVEHRFHHARHGFARARADGDQQRIRGIAELVAT